MVDRKKQKEINKYTNNSLIRNLGISYENFEKLNFDEQQRLIQQYRRKKKKDKVVKVMIGSGENAIFLNKIRGEKYLLSDGTIAIAGATPEESRTRLEDKLDDMTYSKPVAFVKKLSRRLKKRSGNL